MQGLEIIHYNTFKSANLYGGGYFNKKIVIKMKGSKISYIDGMKKMLKKVGTGRVE